MADQKEYGILFQIGSKMSSDFPAAFNKVKENLDKTKAAAKDAGAAWASFGQSAGKVALGFAGVAVAAGASALKLSDEIAQAGDDAAKTAAKYNMSAEGLQQMQYAFEHMGVPTDKFNNSLKLMDKNLVKFASNSKAEKKIKKFGLSAKELRDMGPEKAIELISQKMSEIEDPTKRAELGLALFGNEGHAMAAALANGSDVLSDLCDEAMRTGSVIPNETAAMAEGYQDAKDEMTKSFTGLRYSIGSQLLPIFTDSFKGISGLIQDCLPYVQEFAARIADVVKDNIPKLKDLAARIGEIASKVAEGVVKVKEFVGGWGNLGKILGLIVIAPTAIKGIMAIINTFKFIKTLFPLLKAGFLAVKTALAGVGIGALPLILIIAAIAAAAYIIIKNWDKIYPRLKIVFENVKIKMLELWEKAKEVAGRVVDWIGEKWEEWKPKIIAVLDAIEEAVFKVVDWIREKWDEWGPVFMELWEKAKIKVSETMENIKRIAGIVIDWLSARWEEWGPMILEIWEQIKTTASSVFEKISEIVGNVVAYLTELWEKHGPTVMAIFEKVKSIVVKVITIIAKIIETVVPIVFKIVKTIIKYAGEMWNGIVDVISPIVKFVGKIISAIIGFVLGFYNSFLGYIDAVVTFFADNFDGMKEKAIEIVNGISEKWNEFKTGFCEIIENVKKWFGEKFDDIKTKAAEIWNGLSNGLQAAVDKIKNIFAPIVDWFGEKFGKISDGWRNIKNFFGGGDASPPSGGAAIPKYAKGGILTRPHIGMVAEDGPEAIVPLKGGKNAESIWRKAGEMMGLLDSGASGKSNIKLESLSQSSGNSGSQVIVNYSVTNHFNGSADAGTINEANQKGAESFERQFSAFLENQRRRAFE